MPRAIGGHARDDVEGMWLILQQPEPDDDVLATGGSHTVREFVETAFAILGRRIVWRGNGADEQGVDAGDGRVLVEVGRRYFRPTEVDSLLGDAARARTRLGWRHKTRSDALVREMVEADFIAVRDEQTRRNRAE